jgi:Na+/H+ antiporter NhaD/arsenite permease-like protein
LRNLVFLGVILCAVFIEKPFFLREGIMIGAAIASWRLTPKSIHDSNHFTFHPLMEVALLFVGIFATMIPALDWLGLHAKDFARGTPGFFYWSTGILSAVLDNAPTYLSFLTSSFGLFVTDDLVREVATALQNGATLPESELVQRAVGFLHRHHGVGAASLPVEEIKVALLLANPAWAKIVASISVGAVFFGAATYIGNGPNFMVKAIASQTHCHTPSFFGYILRFTLPCLVPMLLLVWFLFFRG